MLIDAQKSRLLVVDLQTKLMPFIHDHQTLLDNCLNIINVATSIGVPVIASEQYPKGLGPTVDSIRSLIPDDGMMEKEYFSCVSDDGCRATLQDKNFSQVVVIGTESHVCVMQTALELKAAGLEVFLVENCVGSRDPHNKHLAIERMRQAGIIIVSREMVAFEWLRKANTPIFRQISKSYIV
ncbi:MAG: hydrolase [Oceanospirillales bacterium]|nr:MAG: hydrolase [Oceanospirillales bacterium]